MPEYQIQSLDDARLDPYRHLKRRNLTRWSGQFIAEGIKLVERLLESPFEVESILVSQQHRHRLPDSALESSNVFVAPLAVLEQIVGYQFHSGMLACGKRPEPQPLEKWCPNLDRPALIVGCPATTDPDNLGSIIRIAAAFGADGLLVGRKSADPFSRRTLRISMGNAFFLPIFESADFANDLQWLQRESGFTAVASLLDPQAVPLARSPRPKRMVLLLGNEDYGLDDDLARTADQKVLIPMAEKIDSLNVAIAAGIMLHHYTQVCELP